MIEEHQRIQQIHVPPNELHICFQFKPESVGAFGLVCRKAALLATHAYFIVPYHVGAFSTSPEIDEHTGEPADRFYTGDDELAALRSRAAGFPSISVLPERVTTPFGMDATWEVQRALRVKFEKTYLQRQLLEQSTPGGQGVRIFLPHLSGKTDSDVMAVRQNELAESYGNFQSALAKLLHSTAEDGDDALFLIMQEVDENVRRLQDNMRDLRSRRWFDLMNLSILASSWVLILSAPADITQEVNSLLYALGGGTAFSLLQNLFQARHTERSIEADPFFTAWKLA
ncbi:hypothetical protein [Streptomyces venezuelae]|uniref:hypothetical protein n=1 Tax=Streptomyces venezuelae TaxID=54571 RepID=UPI003791C017